MDQLNQLPPGMMLGGGGAPQGPSKDTMMRLTAIEHTYRFATLFGYAPANGKAWSKDVKQIVKFMEDGSELPANLLFNQRLADGTLILERRARDAANTESDAEE